MDKLASLTGLEVNRLDVFSGIKMDSRKGEGDVEHLAAISPVAIGLAMRKVN
jgi:hypothetical protein